MDVTARLAFLECRARRLERTVIALAALALSAFAPQVPEVLRVRGIVVEDSAGRPRVLIGAPVPSEPGRARADRPSGLVYLSADGVDRLQLGEVGGPQMGGKIQPRIAAATGLMVNDDKGDERGGFGMMANGRIVLGLDDADGEGVMLFAAPDLAMNGIFVNGRSGDETRTRASLVATRGGDATLDLHDGAGASRLAVGVTAGKPVISVRDDHGVEKRDLLSSQEH